jgi:carbamoyl-phosphate synthase large subunit
LVFAADIDPLAPSLLVADKVIRVPPIRSDEYVPFLVHEVRARAISVLVPTIDTELPVLSAAAPSFKLAGCIAVVSNPEFVAFCNDKWAFVERFRQCGYRLPRSWLPDTFDADLEEVFIKPRAGSASIGATVVRTSELSRALPAIREPIVQEVVRAKEFTVDALISLDGRPLHYVPRLRLRTLAGESIQGVTLREDRLNSWLEKLLADLSSMGARGPITLQGFLTDGEPTLGEINPRFGGGAPLAFAAGGDYPAWILKEIAGEPVESRLGDFRAGLYMSRAYQEFFMEAPLWD